MDYNQECRNSVQSMGINVAGLSDDLCVTIMEPWDAPENFYCDGEVSHADAKQWWLKSIEKKGGKHLIPILKKMI